MKIIIKDSNEAKITAAIKEAEGRATARTLEYKDIKTALDRIEKRLGIAKKALLGVKVRVDVNAQTFPNAYKWTPESTHFVAERTASGWALTEVYRDRVEGPNSRYIVKLTDEAKDAIIKACSAFFR